MTRVPFEYAVLRVVPRVERGESLNAGVLLYCQSRAFLGARVLDAADELGLVGVEQGLPMTVGRSSGVSSGWMGRR